jgi:hypothetical protein
VTAILVGVVVESLVVVLSREEESEVIDFVGVMVLVLFIVAEVIAPLVLAAVLVGLVVESLAVVLSIKVNE